MGIGISTGSVRPCVTGRNRPIKTLTIIGLFLPFLAHCSFDDTRLDAVKRAGELRVLTYSSITTYYETPEGPAGFEYDLAKAFADSLGVRLRLVVADQFGQVLPRLLNGEADFAAAGVTDTETQRSKLFFTPAYQQVRQQVVYRLGNTRPAQVADLIGRELEIPAGTNHAERLAQLKQAHPELKWTESVDKKSEDLLQLVWEGLLDLTIADSHTIAVNSQFFPELQVAFDLQKPESLAWAFTPSDDTSLYDAAVKFLKTQRRTGVLAQLTDRYYGPASRSNFVNISVYRLRIRTRLPLYQQAIEDAAKQYNLDWRLLAAMAYQESYWDPKVVSPTGVRGLMMLTQSTAQEVGVTNREDPVQSIGGGARYLRDLYDRLPERITGPDRIWFALAAYNVGWNHVEDARVLTQKQGGNPDKWNDVKERLPLLADPKWYEQAKHGQCRGDEPVRFVNRIRTYYDVLARLDDEERAKRTTQALKMKAPAI
jgi:membrane-bound lytic murein transglycosylase F